MGLTTFLVNRKNEILQRCLGYIFDTYPRETSEFLKQEKDRFSNPIGFTIRNEVEIILSELAGGMDMDRLKASLQSIIKIRAVQDVMPSEAIAFVFLLKRAIIEAMNYPGAVHGVRRAIRNTVAYVVEDQESAGVEELFELEEKVDRIALLAFDIYMECREKIHQIRGKQRP